LYRRDESNTIPPSLLIQNIRCCYASFFPYFPMEAR
jgi:hypothetical protein